MYVNAELFKVKLHQRKMPPLKLTQYEEDPITDGSKDETELGL